MYRYSLGELIMIAEFHNKVKKIESQFKEKLDNLEYAVRIIDNFDKFVVKILHKENNNVWYFDFDDPDFGVFKLKQELNNILNFANFENYNCENCYDCRNCNDCYNCVNCYDCSYCNGCYNCVDCKTSIHLYNCNNCKNCENCEKCVDCKTSIHLNNCNNCNDCNYYKHNKPTRNF